ncbi:iron-sulfur cluster repair di-iron protein [Mesobacillus zeae]|uniref:Iron-sulfur cluster repair di-iron protein n=1 Tax=Mesobacillus zeae TaxID=1917180 RepID=A0A398B6W0_9BACI|nr:iron-sulfur cluster repair di-iron protein [Mesobacillus zeae]RID84558.1 iron-sulfur cluster repair di-iron protein [Mesobacillus zeae]
MQLPFNEDTLVKDIVNLFPNSSDIFKKNRIDFCCGGNVKLSEATAERQLNIKIIMDELASLYEKNTRTAEDMEVWTQTDSPALIQHIIENYHRPLEEELSLLSPYVTKVARVHGTRHPELITMHDLFYELKKELLEHTAKEEADVFPVLLALEKHEAGQPKTLPNYIKELESEHDHAGSILKKLRDITADFTPPADACGTFRLVYKRLEILEDQTFMHVHLENNILFPRFMDSPVIL